MTSPSQSAPQGPKAAVPAKAVPVKTKTAKVKKGFLRDDPITVDVIGDDITEKKRIERLLKVVTMQTFAIVGMVAFLILTIPIYHPIFQYFALDPRGRTMSLVALDIPNMTNRAVLSWATTSITEILTIGFGDFEKKLVIQKPRFTPAGWDSFAKAFDNQKTGQTFLENQLVLTTVPSETAVILAQGLNEEGIYQWKVQVPVVMTYATNNNVTRRVHTLINLTIVRVWPEQSPAGIAIKTWS
jgi:hypothetical protein